MLKSLNIRSGDGEVSLSGEKLGFEETLEENVIKAGICVGCGACVVVCPFNCLEYREDHPELVLECKKCGICLRVCPSYSFSLPELERMVFGRVRNPEEEFGVKRRLVIARTTSDKVRNVGQDGGVVTTLLLTALDNGIIEAAAVSSTEEDRPFYPIPKLVTTEEELLTSAGTRYSYSPNLLAYGEGVKEKKSSIAFVGTPCSIRALRKIQAAKLAKFVKPLSFTVGLLCSECFSYDGLMKNHVEKRLGIPLEDVKKVNIKGGIIVTTNSGRVEKIPLKEAKQYAREACKKCTDFSSELADISVGGVGLSGWTFAIIRTEKGEKIFDFAVNEGALETKPVGAESKALGLLLKLTRLKRGRT